MVTSKNTFNIGFKAIIVVILAVLAFGAVLSFIYGYPCLGTFAAGIFIASVCIWIWLSGGINHITFIILLVICLIAIFISFWFGVPNDWNNMVNRVSENFFH